MNELEHPDVTCAQRTGYPMGAEPENVDCRENRSEYLQERIQDFLAWLWAGDEDVIERFIAENQRDYRNWLN